MAKWRAACRGDLAWGGAIVSFACGVVVNDEAVEGGRNDTVATSSPVLCEAAGWEAERDVAVAFRDTELMLVRADGAQRMVHSFAVPPGALAGSIEGAVTLDDRSMTAVLSATAAGSRLRVGTSARLRRSGALVWSLNGLSQGASDAGMGAVVGDAPKLVRADGTSSDIPIPGSSLFHFLGSPDEDGWLNARWHSYDASGRFQHYEGRVNLDGVRYNDEIRSTPSSPPPDEPEWKLEFDERRIPTWLVHRPSGDRQPVRLNRLAPLRLLPTDGCLSNGATLLDDGRLGLALRDEESAGFYVGQADGTGWQRVGEAVRDVVRISGRLIGATWVVRASTVNETYCYADERYAARDAPAVAGDSIQLVLRGQAPVVFQGPRQSQLGITSIDSTGTCVFRRDQDRTSTPRFIDLRRGVSVDIPGLSGFTWLEPATSLTTGSD